MMRARGVDVGESVELRGLVEHGRQARTALAGVAAREVQGGPGAPPTDARLAAWLARGRALAALGQDGADEALRAALDAAHSLALPTARRAALVALGAWLAGRGDRVIGRAHLERALDEATRVRDTSGAAEVVAAAAGLAHVRALDGDLSGAEAALGLAREALGRAPAARARFAVAAAGVARSRGDPAGAAAALAEVVPASGAVTDPVERAALLVEAAGLAADLAGGTPTRGELSALPPGDLAAVVEVGLAAAAGPAAQRGLALCAWVRTFTGAERVALEVEGRVLGGFGAADGPPAAVVRLGAAAFTLWGAVPDARAGLLLRVLLGHAGSSGPQDDAAQRTLLLLQRVLDAGLDLDRLVLVATDLAVEATGAARGFLLLRAPGAQLGFTAARRGGADVVDPGGVVSTSLVREAVRLGRAILLADAAGDPERGASESVGARGLRSVLVAPVIDGGEVLGALYLDDPGTVGRFGPLEREVAVGFASRLGAPLRAVLEREAERARVSSVAAALARPSARAVTRRAFPRVIGRSSAIGEVLRLLDRAAAARASVLLTGESGSGKEVVARSLHEASDRASGPFQAVSCAALADGVLESELFGHAAGAFTGATGARKGLFELACGGTLFLDELQEASPRLQAELLRALETGEVRPVGAADVKKVDVRVVAATNVDLAGRLASGAFREDLYHRLAVVHVRVPPLRERLEDVPDLVAHFLTQANRPDALGPGTLARLLGHAWPGNVRALRNCLERALVFAGDGQVLPEHVVLDAAPRAAEWKAEPAARGAVSLAAVELGPRQLRLLEIVRAEGEVTNAGYAERMGISQPTGWRDLRDLVAKGLLVASGRARNTSYRLAPGWEARLRGQ
jgi:DNA-binding NtrC family response regulator